ncbi:uncharacterized protein N7459_004772 [Penicillium hispanicum]|uniref:uncharacterized protein n=1 Tax=Penicillium hispanicum TaxID=1080232 RepID=UPI002540AF26|nr:uncharacterized protein N7459_004772 [Penicillium hispanicum]KAJ5584972.1 hypothetical protein N7459_004772 [Penicillium hispanicum]
MTTAKPRLRIASLGSSYASGPGIPPQLEPRAARRSGQNYAHLLADRLDADLTDLSVAGATLLNITQDPQTAPLSSQVFPPQIRDLPADADIITLTGGGNDIGYIGGMMSDAWSATTPGMLSNSVLGGVRALSSLFSAQPPQPEPPLSSEALAGRFGDVLDAIHRKAPSARVFLVEYVAVLGPDTRPGRDIPFNQERVEHHMAVASALQRAYELAVQGRSDWCERVPVHELSLGHALGSPEPWVTGFALSAIRHVESFLHPNLEGMKGVADLLLPRVQKHLK